MANDIMSITFTGVPVALTRLYHWPVAVVGMACDHNQLLTHEAVFVTPYHYNAARGSVSLRSVFLTQVLAECLFDYLACTWPYRFKLLINANQESHFEAAIVDKEVSENLNKVMVAEAKRLRSEKSWAELKVESLAQVFSEVPLSWSAGSNPERLHIDESNKGPIKVKAPLPDTEYLILPSKGLSIATACLKEVASAHSPSYAQTLYVTEEWEVANTIQAPDASSWWQAECFQSAFKSAPDRLWILLGRSLENEYAQTRCHYDAPGISGYGSTLQPSVHLCRATGDGISVVAHEAFTWLCARGFYDEAAKYFPDELGIKLTRKVQEASRASRG